MDNRFGLPVNTVLDNDYRICRVVGSGGFGITYEAEDKNLGTTVAIKEYYPLDFGDRDSTMSVRPKSERHKPTFEKGRSNFLQEARTLARFEHPSIVRVTRVFEANSTAYMVMRFEQGQSFDAWLRGLGRPPTQAELDSVVAPLLDALELMHAASFLHRDIAPDNIIIRTDGSPVLLDFGAARRAVAEMSRSLTGIVKAGYSPHEQYATDGRLQGPWSDLYALGGTLYRAVTGRAPEEAALRVDDDRMAPATQAARSSYRAGFLSAIDACLKVRYAERPQSVAQLRPMLLGPESQPKTAKRLPEPSSISSARPATRSITAGRWTAWRWPAVAAMLVLLGGAYGGYQYQRANPAGGASLPSQLERAAAGEEARRRAAAADAAVQGQAALEAERQQREKEAADARQHRIEIEEARRRKELADAAEAEARRKAKTAAGERRKAEARIAALEEARRREEDARRKADADAEAKRKEEIRIAALEETRRNEEKRKEDERVRLAVIPDDEVRAALVRRVQQALGQAGCYSGPINGNNNDAQKGLDAWVDNASKSGKAAPRRIELAKASVGDFESWLSTASAIKGDLCVPPRVGGPSAKPKPEKAKPVASRGTERPAEERKRAGESNKPARGRGDLENCLNQCHAAGGRRSDPRRCNRRCGA